MEKKTVTVVDRLNDIVERINLTDKLDMTKLPDLEKAKETVSQLKNDFKTLCEESPFVQKMLNFTTAFMQMDVKEELEKMGKMIDEKITEIKSKTASAATRVEKDNSEGECNCYFCGCDNCPNNDLDEELIEDYPMDGRDVARELDNEFFKDVAQSTDSQKKTLCNLIAEFLNDRYSHLNYNDPEDAEEIEDLCNILFEFADYTLHRD